MFRAQRFSVGRFYLGFPQHTRGTGAFCVCQGLAKWASKTVGSLLFCPLFSSKETPTFSSHRTHIAMCDKGLNACRFFEFASRPGRATENQNSTSTLLRIRASPPRLAGLVCRRPNEDVAHRAWQGIACHEFADQFNKTLDMQANRDSV